MRHSRTACRTGLTVIATAVVLSACGGSGEEDSAARTTAGSDFCREAAAVQERLGAAFTGASDPNSLSSLLREAVPQIRQVDPPEELRADWSVFADGVEQIAAAAQADLTDPNAAAEFQRRVSEVQQQYGDAFTRVDTYLAQECGLGDASTPPAAPTS